MTAVWVFLGVLAALLAALLGAAAFFFKFSICRYKRERADEQYEEQDSIWKDFFYTERDHWPCGLGEIVRTDVSTSMPGKEL